MPNIGFPEILFVAVVWAGMFGLFAANAMVKNSAAGPGSKKLSYSVGAIPSLIAAIAVTVLYFLFKRAP